IALDGIGQIELHFEMEDRSRAKAMPGRKRIEQPELTAKGVRTKRVSEPIHHQATSRGFHAPGQAIAPVYDCDRKRAQGRFGSHSTPTQAGASGAPTALRNPAMVWRRSKRDSYSALAAAPM